MKQDVCIKVGLAACPFCVCTERYLSSVEYAMEAISHAGTVLGVLAKDGVVLAAEKKVTGKLLDLSSAKEGGYGGSGEKIYLLNSCVPYTFDLRSPHLKTRFL